jgi:hypothetical protein
LIYKIDKCYQIERQNPLLYDTNKGSNPPIALFFNSPEKMILTFTFHPVFSGLDGINPVAKKATV